MSKTTNEQAGYCGRWGLVLVIGWATLGPVGSMAANEGMVHSVSPSREAQQMSLVVGKSIVVLFGTGQGLTSPDFPEDEIASDPLPEPVDPVTVTIGGKQAEILYAGAAPGMQTKKETRSRKKSGFPMFLTFDL